MSAFGMNLRVTTDSKQGGRKYMEDCLSVKFQKSVDGKNIDFTYLGVFDGHGGVHAAQFAKENLLDEITKQKGFWSEDDNQIMKAIKDGFLSTHQKMWKIVGSWPKTLSGHPSTAGTTASVVFMRNGRLYVGHVGDSSVVIGHRKESMRSNLTADMITVDHKPESKKELKRIEESGGAVVAKAGVQRVVWNRPRNCNQGVVRRSTPIDRIPFLAIARALGDLWSYNTERDVFVVSPEPDVSTYTLDVNETGCIVLASDGLWNMVRPQEAVDLVDRLDEQSKDPYSGVKPASHLVQLALERWSDRNLRADNTSVIVCILDPPEGHELPLSKQSSGTSSLPTVRLSSDSEECLSDSDCGSDDISMDCEEDGNMSHLHMGSPGFPKIMYPSPHILKSLGQHKSPVDSDLSCSPKLKYPRVITGCAERFTMERKEKTMIARCKLKTPRSAPPKLKRLNSRQKRKSLESHTPSPMRKVKSTCKSHKYTMAQMRKRIAMSFGNKPSSLSEYLSHSHNLRLRSSPQKAEEEDSKQVTDRSGADPLPTSQDLCGGDLCKVTSPLASPHKKVASPRKLDTALTAKNNYTPLKQHTPSKNEREGNRSPKQALSAKSPLRIQPVLTADTPAMISPMWPSSLEADVGPSSQLSQPGALVDSIEIGASEIVLTEQCTNKSAAVRNVTTLFCQDGCSSKVSVTPATRGCVKRKLQALQEDISGPQLCVKKIKTVVSVGKSPRTPRRLSASRKS